ncbi:MAG: tyrosine-type recombinase/integrase [Nitrospirota bacterium]
MGLSAESDIRFVQWADKWYEGYKGQVSDVTYESYKYTLRILKDEFSNRKLRSIKPLDIENFLKSLQAERSDSAVTKCRGMMHQIMHKAEANDLILKNPVRLADKIKRKSSNRKSKDSFTKEEVSILFDKLPLDKMGHTIRLLIGTGMRAQEVVCLEKKHITEDGNMIMIRQAVENLKGKTILREDHTKSSLSVRDIPVPEYVRESAVFLREQANPFVWDGKIPGTVFNLRNFRAKYLKTISAVGIRQLTPHCLRHTYVTLLQSLGVPMEVIAALTGHADVETTNGYLHIQPDTAENVCKM